MKDYLRRTALCALILGLAFTIPTILSACGSGSASAAGDSVTMAQVNAAIAAAVDPLKQQIGDQADQITALKNSQPTGEQLAALQKVSRLYLSIAAPNLSTQSLHPESYGASGTGLHPQTTQPTCTGLGTITGHPTSSDPRTSDLLAGVSCTGYLYTINASQAGGMSHIQPLGYPVWAEAGCQGTMYILTTGVSQLALNGGIIFTMPAGMVSDWSDVANYFYLPPHPTAQTITVLSGYDPAQGCAAMSSYSTAAYAALPNDPTVTAVPSGLIPGPVGMGTAGGG